MRKQNAKVVCTPSATVMGDLLAQIQHLTAALQAASVSPKGPKATPKGRKAKPKASTPEWIKDFAAKKAARRRLAAEMRAKGIEITEASWKAAKAANGIA
jgi:hypothetical protein